MGHFSARGRSVLFFTAVSSDRREKMVRRTTGCTDVWFVSHSEPGFDADCLFRRDVPVVFFLEMAKFVRGGVPARDAFSYFYRHLETCSCDLRQLPSWTRFSWPNSWFDRPIVNAGAQNCGIYSKSDPKKFF